MHLHGLALLVMLPTAIVAVGIGAVLLLICVIGLSHLIIALVSSSEVPGDRRD